MIPLYGRKLTIFSDRSPDGRTEQGILQPVSTQEQRSHPRIHTAPGLREQRRYRVFLLPEALQRREVCDRIVCDGAEYELLTADPYLVGSVQTHWEGLLRLKGEVSDG